ncbi:hypothetical protein QBC46DRAFT_428504 [Diplogelasinospora grovesii]|uniref:Chromo domain-containing protein n=1 Tax=Diplogelasinospora grovesii TaxID=303347 RepID=A0AAN6MVH2_9PEZI|nr:hypothetical protein QBC46DRAFT_428504 [Diplogelasinospora grovesii]
MDLRFVLYDPSAKRRKGSASTIPRHISSVQSTKQQEVVLDSAVESPPLPEQINPIQQHAPETSYKIILQEGNSEPTKESRTPGFQGPPNMGDAAFHVGSSSDDVKSFPPSPPANTARSEQVSTRPEQVTNIEELDDLQGHSSSAPVLPEGATSTAIVMAHDEASVHDPIVSTARGRHMSPTEDEATSSEEGDIPPGEWPVEQIIEEDVNGKRHFLVRWKPTLEPAENLMHLEKIIREWEKKKAGICVGGVSKQGPAGVRRGRGRPRKVVKPGKRD